MGTVLVIGGCCIAAVILAAAGLLIYVSVKATSRDT
jgi:hypothetical protein